MIEIQVRGVPTFAWTKPMTFPDIPSALSYFALKGKISSWPPELTADFYDPITSKRVFLYVEISDENKELIEKFCVDEKGKFFLYISFPDEARRLEGRPRCFGVGRGRIGEWQSLSVRHHKDYSSLMESLKKERSEKIKRAAELEKLEEERECLLQEAVQQAVLTHGHDKVISCLNSL